MGIVQSRHYKILIIKSDILISLSQVFNGYDACRISLIIYMYIQIYLLRENVIRKQRKNRHCLFLYTSTLHIENKNPPNQSKSIHNTSWTLEGHWIYIIPETYNRRLWVSDNTGIRNKVF